MAPAFILLPWSRRDEDERRFLRSQAAVLGPLMLLVAIIPHLPVFLDKIAQIEETPPVVKLTLIPRKPPPPPPQPEGGGVQQTPKPKPVVRTPPTPRPAQSAEDARARAARSGILALGSEIATLRNSPVITSVQGDRALNRGTPQGQPSDSTAIRQGVDRGSGGINTTSIGQGSGGGTALNEGRTGRGTGIAQGAGGTGGGSGGGTGGSGTYVPKRTSESIQLVFDRNKAAFESMYQRALRQNPALQGAVVFELTILPSGRVTACRVISSELRDPELEAKLVSRILLLEFGAEEVPTIKVVNPLRFYPR